MRNLTSIESSTSVLLDLEFHLKASDQSTTWIFGNRDIKQYPEVSWEIPYQGGVGKTSDYKITLQTSIGFIRANYSNIYKANAFLKVFVNSDNFTPHFGKITSIERDADNTDTLKLHVLDSFFESEPKIPNAAIVDSYTTAHPEVSNYNLGYSLYYGKHTRPIYFTPVDCDISVLLAPTHVSTDNHVSSIWFNPDLSTNSGYILLDTEWDIATNITSHGNGFEVINHTTSDSLLFKFIDSKLLEHQGVVNLNTGIIIEPTVKLNKSPSFNATPYQYYYHTLLPTLHRDGSNSGLEVISNFKTQGVGKFGFTSDIDASSYFHKIQFLSGGNQKSFNCGSSTLLVTSDVPPTGFLVSDNNLASMIVLTTIQNSTGSPESQNWEFLLSMNPLFHSDNYKNYSVFASPVNCSDIAVSENPNEIVRDLINNHSSLSIHGAQNSHTQLETTDFNFQCFFDERQRLSTVLNEFGEITGTYYWMGDSGFLNSKTYQESTVLTNCVDYTLTASDIVYGTLKIKDNPLGITLYESEKASRIKMEYDYDFGLDKYLGLITADKNNAGFCNSLSVAGIENEISFSTNYVKETATASLQAVNFVRRYAANYSLLEFNLPAQFMGMEAADVLQINHPSLLTTPSVFQVTKIYPDYQNGGVKVTANEIANL
jgi:hypothetical protein